MYSSGVVRALRRCLATDAGAKATDAAERVMITFSDFAGTQRTLPCKVGDSLLVAAREHNLPIDGACGGGGAPVELFGEGPQCTYCHVDVAREYLDKLPPVNWREQEMLGEIPNIKSNTRLACQITVTPDMEGMRVAIPEYDDSEIP
ncbi:2Fe-2S ferredoxin-type domain-containing protein [Plasmodiophora brassicae]|uniref:2Fe-2S ferredoxin-type domain-containing protein n=1 Tax=Plasmodiophora brassicae TaxID=37360 RepID=A0A0G4IZ14_PLABS|nr:hypothetical protein PBRA_008000 [Plasmodiophora brassicae]SPQ96527.1 unnamed protein product [Plasmodiophora brassicae]